tara:strand:+ start:1795 stop:2754 length:960 start_codon:yes stop_codon:yes gene_type:complete
MKISIAMTSYNGEKYITEQIESILQQSILPDEIVIIDDCSIDKTYSILEKYKESKLVNFKIYRNKNNLGFTKNFEKAISICNGDIIFLCDQDDIWYKDKIKIILEKFKRYPYVDLIVHNADLVNENLIETDIDILSQIISGFKNTDVFITGALTVFKKNLKDIILPFPNYLLGHDGYIHYIARNLGVRLVIKECLQKFRRHSNNTSNWIVSSLKKVKKFDIIKSQFNSNRSNNYNDRLYLVNNVIEIIENLISKPNKYSTDFIKLSLLSLKEEKKAIMCRNMLADSNFYYKKYFAFKLLYNNHYKYFNGILSFLRDLIR